MDLVFQTDSNGRQEYLSSSVYRTSQLQELSPEFNKKGLRFFVDGDNLISSIKHKEKSIHKRFAIPKPRTPRGGKKKFDDTEQNNSFLGS
jgi:hypothetical protein